MDQGTTLKFSTSVAKVLKLKVRKFWGLHPTFVEVIGEKLVGDLFAPLPPILNRVKKTAKTEGLKPIKQKWKIKQRIDLDQGNIHQLLCSTCLKAETEGLIMASQDQSLFTRNCQAIIIKKGADSSFVKNSKICRSTSIWIIHNDS